MNALKVRDFGLIASDRLAMVKGRAGDVSVKSYYLPDTERWGNPLLDFACDAINFYLYDEEYYEEALDAFRIIQELGGDPMYAFLAMIWQGHVLDLLGKREEAIKLYREAHQKMKEPGLDGEWRHDQYGLVINKKWVEGRLKSPFRRRRT